MTLVPARVWRAATYVRALPLDPALGLVRFSSNVLAIIPASSLASLVYISFSYRLLFIGGEISFARLQILAPVVSSHSLTVSLLSKAQLPFPVTCLNTYRVDSDCTLQKEVRLLVSGRSILGFL